MVTLKMPAKHKISEKRRFVKFYPDIYSEALPEMSGPAAKLYLTFKLYVKHQGKDENTTFVSRKKLAEKLGVSVDWVGKYIAELKNLCEGSVRIGFKLESGIKQKDLIHRAVAQIEKSGMTATIANRLEDLNDDTKPRAWLVDKTGAHYKLETNSDLCEAILSVILNNR